MIARPPSPRQNNASQGSQVRTGVDLCRLQEDQHRRWARGERVFVEDYLGDLESRIEDPDDILDLIYHEVLVREEFGEDRGSTSIWSGSRNSPRRSAISSRMHLALKFTAAAGTDDSRRARARSRRLVTDGARLGASSDRRFPATR